MRKIKGMTTMKPLSGGKFKCNQTGQIVSGRRTKACARARDMQVLGQGARKALLKKQDQERKLVEQARKKREAQQDSWRTLRYGGYSLGWGW